MKDTAAVIFAVMIIAIFVAWIYFSKKADRGDSHQTIPIENPVDPDCKIEVIAIFPKGERLLRVTDKNNEVYLLQDSNDFIRGLR